MQTLIIQASADVGENALGLDPRNGDRLWIDLNVSWLTAVDDEVASTIITQLATDIETYTESTYPGIPNTRYVSGNLRYEEFNPIYSNDAMPDQTPYKTYGRDNYVRLKSIQRAVDPDGFFNTRTGGFKYD